MNQPRRSNPDFLNGVPELLILRLLTRQAMHGYDLVQSIRLQSGNTLEFGEGCIYPILHRLEKQGDLRSQREPVAGRTRVVYSVTAKGLRRLAESTATWERVVHAVSHILKESAMPNRSAREAMRAELRRQGLPRAEIARLLEEWDDHLTDLITEQGGTMNMETQEKAQVRLGHPDLLIAAAVANQPRTSFFGRHPVWTFVVAPIPLVAFCWAAFFFLVLGVGALAGAILGPNFELEGKTAAEWPAAAVWGAEIFHLAIRLVPPAVAVMLLCWAGRRSGVRLAWTLTAIGLVVLLAACFHSQLAFSDVPGGNTFTMGFGFPFSLHSLPQALVPLAVGLLCIWSMFRGHKLAAA